MSSTNTIPVRLAYKNSVVAENIYSMLMSLNKSVYTIEAVKNSSKSVNVSANEFGGFQPVLQLSVEARVLFLLNLLLKNGLCNGSMGEAKSLIYKGNFIAPSLPIAI